MDDLDKFPGVIPLVIREVFRNFLAKLILHAGGNQKIRTAEASTSVKALRQP